MNLSTYVQRLNYFGPLKPTTGTLRALHQAHLLTVPFENLDIHLDRPIVLDETALFSKIVERHYQQSSPQSHFTQKRVCSLATAEGRIRLSDFRLIITSPGSVKREN